MDSITEIMQLCRLCLVKDEVNIPIFEEHGDIRQILLKISACLPVKVSKEDNLPKNICDGCSCKLDMLYQFWNTSANSEKKLIRWMDQIGVDKLSDKDETAIANSLHPQHSISSNPMILKQEVVDVADNQSTGDDLVPDDLNVSNDAQDYIMQQQQLPYQPVEFQFQQDGFETVAAEDESSNVEVESQPTKRKRRAAAMKALANMESEDEDDPDLINKKIAKTEEQSDDSAGEDPEPTTFVGLPSADDEQPGPSGIGKSSSDAPFRNSGSDDKKIHQCKVCSKTYSSAACLKRHSLIHSGEKPFSCDVCQKRFTFAYSVKNHKSKCRGPDVTSSLCNKYIGSDDKIVYQCKVCWKTFKSATCVKRHALIHSGEKQFSCDMCPKRFALLYTLKTHKKRRHEPVQLFECDSCGRKLKSKKMLELHQNRHMNKYSCSCPICNQGFYSLAEQRQHVKRIHESVIYECKICGRPLKTPQSLNLHEQMHDADYYYSRKKFKCNVCDKVFSCKSYLTKHVKMHTGDNVYICYICGKSYSQRSHLQNHLLLHKDNKPYKCDVCKKGFAKNDNLRIHQRSHTGFKPYRCEFCGKAFAQRPPLNVHLRYHTGERPYKCELCDKGFVSKGSMDVHRKSKHCIL